MANSAFTVTGSATGTGTVTSIAISSSDSRLTVSGSPVTTSGTIDLTLNTVTVPFGGTGLTSLTAYAVMCGGTTGTGNMQQVSGVGTSGQVLTSNGAGSLPTWQSAGGSGTVSAGSQNQLAWYAANGTTVSGLATANDGVLVTSAGGVPSIGSTLPLAVQGNITTVGTVTSGTWNATAIAPTHGGTGLTSYNQGDILYASAANTLSALAKSITATRYLANTGSSNNPNWDQVNLANGVTGNLPVTNLNSGSGASSGTFWRGDGAWGIPPGSGGSGATTLLNYNGATQTVVSQVNVSSVTYQNVGRYRVTFTVPYATGNYVTQVATTPIGGGTTAQTAFVTSPATTTTAFVDVEAAGFFFEDNDYFGVAVFDT